MSQCRLQRRHQDVENRCRLTESGAGRLRAISNQQNRLQLLGHSDVRVTMRYVRMVEGSKRVALEAVKLTFGKVGHVTATWPKQPQLPVAVTS